MSNPNDPNLEQQPATDAPVAPEAPAAPAAPAAPQAPQYAPPPAPEAPQYAPPAPMGTPVPQFTNPTPPPPAPPAPPYGQQGYVQPQPGAAAAGAPTNTMAIISMISSIVGLFTFGILCLLGVILGHISLGQIKRKNEGGKGMAVAGLIVGYIGLVGWVIALILIFVSLAIFGAALSDPNLIAELENMS